MASTASALLRQELMAQTENNGTWGNKTVVNQGILELAITGVFAISTTGGSTTLANVDYTADDAKNRTLDVSGTLASDATIVIPNLKRTFRINNRTSGSFAVKVKTSSGTAVSVTQSTICDVICDGSNGITFATPMTNPTTGAPATASGAAASSVSVVPTGNLSSSNGQAAFSELQGDIDTINALLISGYQPLAARLTDLSSVAATKGNLYLGNGTNIVALGVGSDGNFLVADNASSTGMKSSPVIQVGNVTLWYQAAAPTGWTVSNADDDKAVRIVNGTGATGGSAAGTTAFSSIMAARTILKANLPSYNLTVTDPGHAHSIGFGFPQNFNNGTSTSLASFASGTTTGSSTTGISVNSGGSGTAMDFAVQYCNVIKAAKAAY